MKATLKSDITGFYRTEDGYIHIQTEFFMHDRDVTKEEHLIKYATPKFKIFDHHGGLIITFANNVHVRVSTRNNGDPIGYQGWRHIAHDIVLDLLHDEVVADAYIEENKRERCNRLSRVVIEQLHKLATFE